LWQKRAFSKIEVLQELHFFISATKIAKILI
jgi:hypothetical protein